MLRNLFIFVIVLMMFISACSTTEPKVQVTEQLQLENTQYPYPAPEIKPNSEAYPPPVKTVENDSYPAPEIKPNSEAYPPPVKTLVIDPYPDPEEIPSDIIPFNFIKPLNDGDTQVSGTGPAGVPIEIVNVTFMRLVLAQGIIADDNTFTFELSEPLERGNQIGIFLSDLSGTEWTDEQFTNKFYNGDQAMNVPTVGFFFDTAMVK